MRRALQVTEQRAQEQISEAQVAARVAQAELERVTEERARLEQRLETIVEEGGSVRGAHGALETELADLRSEREKLREENTAARKQAAVLGSTPAALIASAPDLSALRKDFDLQEAGNKDGLQWVQATPKAKDGQLNQMKLGFRANDLAALEILDSFGQTSVMKFERLQLNTPLPADTFTFRAPPGADVVRQ